LSVFVVNPGSTSMKLALFEKGKALVSRELQYDKSDLARFERVMDQRDFRMSEIREFLLDPAVDESSIDAVVGRGGLLHPLQGGVYEVSDDMLHDLKKARYGEHPCNLGAVLAHDLALELSVPAFIVDPVVTDEMQDVARLTGLPGLDRRSLFHALNQRGAARVVSERLGVEYGVSNFIVCHMGGGISIGAHRHGKVVDVVNALDGEGPFSSERTGGLPVIPLLDMIQRGEKTPEDLKRIIQREGGLFAHLGTNDPRKVLVRIAAGDEKASLVLESLSYNVAKHVTSLFPALVDETGAASIAAVILTGGLARSDAVVEKIRMLVRFLGPVEVVTGEVEMEALAAGAERALGCAGVVMRYHSDRA